MRQIIWNDDAGGNIEHIELSNVEAVAAVLGLKLELVKGQPASQPA